MFDGHFYVYFYDDDIKLKLRYLKVAFEGKKSNFGVFKSF